MPGVRILFASGEAEFSDYVRGLLVHTGYAVLDHVSSLDAAGRAAARERPALILLDLDLCAGGGVETAAQVQAALEIPIVFLVGQDQGKLFRQALKTSPYGFLLRPVSRLGLESAIEMALRRHALHLKLKERESELRTLVENVPGVVYRCEVDSPWRMEQMSDGVRALTGRHKDEFLAGQVTWAGITWPADLPYVEREVRAAVEQGRPYQVTYRIVDTSGGIRWIEDSGRCIDGRDGRHSHLDGVLMDVTERRVAEQARASAHNELQAIYTSVPVALMLVDKDRRVQKANVAASVVAGMPEGSMANLRAGEALRCLNALDDERGCGFGPLCPSCPIRSAVHQTFEDGIQRQGIEAWMALGDADAARRVCLLVTTTLLHYNGEPKVLVSAQDITEKKQSEAALEAERAKLRAVYEHAPTMMCVLDGGGMVLYKNKAFESLIGGPAAVAQPREADGGEGACRILRNTGVCGEALCCAECKLCEAVSSTLATGAEHVDVEFRTVLKRDGGRLTVVLLCSTAMIRTGGYDRLLLCLTDITGRRLAEEALIESERRFAQAAELTREMIWEVDPSGLYTYVSAACYQILGYRPEEIAGTLHYYDLHPAEGREEFIEQAHAAIGRGERFVDFYNPKCAKDGRILDISTNAAPVFASDGRLLCYRGADRDITEARRTEARLVQVQKMESVGRLAGGVAHDFNNLLTVINGYGQLVLDKLAEHDPNRPHVNEILKAGERAASLTKQLLAFSRNQKREPKVIDLNAVVSESLPMVEQLAGENVALETELDRSAGPVLADRHQMEQVVMNLAVNARDAMPAGGRLSFRVWTALKDHASVRHHGGTSGAYTVLTVSDTGSGMDEITRQRMFEPFFTTKEMGRGTGLGLSIVHGIVEQSNGFIEVSSEPGRGTSFSVFFPAAQAMPEGKTAAPEDEAGSGRETILVVEDMEAVRLLTIDMLTELGYRVLAAGGPDEALRLAGKAGTGIDLLLTDLAMPGMNGRALAAELRKMRPGLKVAYMSGGSDVSAEGDQPPGDGACFIQKPFGPKDLARTVRAALGS